MDKLNRSEKAGRLEKAGGRKSAATPLDHVTIKKADHSHIAIREKERCFECENKPCTFYCPTRVFSWEEDEILVAYGRCVECGACPWGCPYDNIDWRLPPGGFGVIYEH